MAKVSALFAIAALFMTVTPVLAAPPVVEEPGRCAAAFPNANCQNYGPGHPGISYGWGRARWHHGHHHWRHWYSSR